MVPLVIGSPAIGTPAAYIAVYQDHKPCARIDAFVRWRGPFTELIVWDELVVIGWSDVVHLIDPARRTVISIGCDGYFGHLYALDGALLIASASELICVDAAGDVLWRQANLGLDGVVVSRIEDGTIHGDGEWDPPGGWRPFQLSLATGTPVAHR